MPVPAASHLTAQVKFRASPSFTLVEMLVVLGIIAILTAITVPLIPSLLRGNVMNSNVQTLSGIMEQAREAAISGNTYVWVAFSTTNTTPANGIWVATVESQDGTESPINITTTASWTNAITIPTNNLILVSKLQNLRGVQITEITNALIPSSLTNQLGANGITNPAPLFTTNTIIGGSGAQWTLTPLLNTEGYSASTPYFTRVIEFTPDGEAHVMAWNPNIAFGMIPSVGASTSTNDDVLMNVSRLTGRMTVFRP